MRATVPTILPGNWTSMGCYRYVSIFLCSGDNKVPEVDSLTSDNTGGVRTLQGANYASNTNMTVENCISFCDASSFVYAGVCPYA